MTSSLIILFFLFLTLLMIGAPLVVALGLASACYLLIEGFPIAVMAQRMFTGIDIFLLMSMPLFALAGELMNVSKLSDRLMAFSQALVGRIKGGLAAVNVVSSVLFAGISGSAAADASATGSLLIPLMKRAGYTGEFSAALTAITSVVGPIIPPSIVFIMYSALTDVSVMELFLAGIIPGVLMSLGHLSTAIFIAYRRGYEIGEPTSIKRITTTGTKALPVLMIPLIIVGGIVLGLFTPTESGAVAVFYTLVLGLLWYRSLTPKMIFDSGWRVGIQIADILLIIAASNVLAWILTIEQVPQLLIDSIAILTTNPYITLLLINLLMLVVGMFLDTFPAMIILTPILLPISESINIDPVHFGVIMTLNLMLGATTPPVGILLLITRRIAHSNLAGTIYDLLPFFFTSLIILLAVCMFPQLSLFLVK